MSPLALWCLRLGAPPNPSLLPTAEDPEILSTLTSPASLWSAFPADADAARWLAVAAAADAAATRWLAVAAAAATCSPAAVAAALGCLVPIGLLMQYLTDTRDIYYEQRNKHDAPPNWTNSSEGDETLAFALIGPAMYEHMSVDDCDPHVLSGLSVWRLYHLLGSALADGKLIFMANEFGHPDALDLPRPANHFDMQRAFRRWTLAESPNLKFTQCELFDCCVNHWAALFGWPSASHLYVVTCDEEAQVVVVERGPCLFAFNFHPHASYEGYHVGCMYSEPLRLFLDSDERRFGGFGRLTPRTQHPVSSAKDSRPHSVKIYLPSSTCAVLTMQAESYVEYRNIDRSPKI
ncbi:hypothetical protein ACSSS7_008161 [Eimeria intestinalis]